MITLKAGEQIYNYQVTGKPLGKGGMGSVYPAVNIHDPDEKVVLKVLDLPEAADRFKQEAALLKSLKHTGLVEYYTYFEHRGAMIIVMQMVEGVNFRDTLYNKTATPFYDLLLVAEQVLDVLCYLHTEAIDAKTQRPICVIHRDIKPGNVMVVRPKVKGGKLKALVVDLGIASDGTKSHGTKAGTANYSHPNQLSGYPAIPFFDIFSWGAMMFEALTWSMKPEERLLPFPYLETTVPGTGIAGPIRAKQTLENSAYLSNTERPFVIKLIAIVLKAIEFQAAKSYPNALVLRDEVRALRAEFESKHGMAPSTPPMVSAATPAKPTTSQTQLTGYGKIETGAGAVMPIDTKRAQDLEDDVF